MFNDTFGATVTYMTPMYCIFFQFHSCHTGAICVSWQICSTLADIERFSPQNDLKDQTTKKTNKNTWHIWTGTHKNEPKLIHIVILPYFA